MVIVALIIMFAVFILGEWIYLHFREKDLVQDTHKIKESEIVKERYYHPGHTWVDLNPEDLTVEIGMDSFTNKVFGQVEKIDFPQKGEIIHQGNPIWKLIRGNRNLVQVSPMSGKVLDVNSNSFNAENWIIKLRPVELQQNLNNLFQGDLVEKWQAWSKNLFVQRLSNQLSVVYQDGGELRDNLSEEISDAQWEKIQCEFFYPSYWLGNI